MLFLFLSFLFELFTEWEHRGVEVSRIVQAESNTTDGFGCGWLIAALFGPKRIPVWACWRTLCP